MLVPNESAPKGRHPDFFGTSRSFGILLQRELTPNAMRDYCGTQVKYSPDTLERTGSAQLR